MPANAAVILAIPASTPAANPVLSMVAAAVLSVFQVTREVMSAVVPSEYVPTALNCWVCPLDKLGGGLGVTAIDVNTGVPVNVVDVFEEEQPVTPKINKARNAILT